MLPTADAAANALYLAHAVLELVLGMLKLRGRYQHETPGERPPRSAMYVRHHGFSLLALAYLGAVMWWRGLVNADIGGDVSVVSVPVVAHVKVRHLWRTDPFVSRIFQRQMS